MMGTPRLPACHPLLAAALDPAGGISYRGVEALVDLAFPGGAFRGIGHAGVEPLVHYFWTRAEGAERLDEQCLHRWLHSRSRVNGRGIVTGFALVPLQPPHEVRPGSLDLLAVEPQIAPDRLPQ